MKIFFLSLALFTLAGCALIAPKLDRIADKGADYIVEYCSQTDENARAMLRQAVNDKLPQGYAAAVTCPPDS